MTVMPSGNSGKPNGLTILGTVSLDTIRTPEVSYADGLGGSAAYAALSAGRFVRPNMVARCGDGLAARHVALLEAAADIRGLSYEGRTFRYEGAYPDGRTPENIRVEYNTPEGYGHDIPEEYRASGMVLLANEDPARQVRALERFDGPELVMCDTISGWVGRDPEGVMRALGSADIAILNDAEARRLTGEREPARCAGAIRRCGACHVIIKKGEHGSVLFSGGRAFPLPAYPLEAAADPTGAGDAFAGAVMGYMAAVGRTDLEELRRACSYGNVLGSFAAERAGNEGLVGASDDMVRGRVDEYRALLSV